MKSPTKVAVITGASSGIGYTTAQFFQEQGWQVYGLSRSGKTPAQVVSHQLDITDHQATKAIFALIWQKEGRIDLILNAAGIGGAGPVETFPTSEVERIMSTNFFGTVNISQAALPYLRQQQRGILAFVSSVAGLMGLPYHGIYVASKFAVEGLVESLRLELRGSGVQVTSICPGDTATPIISNQYRAIAAELPEFYKQNYSAADEGMKNSVDNGIPPVQIAQHVYALTKKKTTHPRYVVGPWLQTLAPTIKRLLPARWFEYVMATYYGQEN